MPDINDQIREHTPLALFTLRKYHPTICGDEDIRQVAMIALWKAIKTYNPDKGVPFSTFTIYCINRAISVTLRDQKAKKRTGTIVYLDDSVPGTENLIYADTITSTHDVSFFDLEGIEKKLTDEDRDTIDLILSCKNQSEIARKTGQSGATVSRKVRRVRQIFLDHCI